jgi:hypothetical protein
MVGGDVLSRDGGDISGDGSGGGCGGVSVGSGDGDSGGGGDGNLIDVGDDVVSQPAQATSREGLIKMNYCLLLCVSYFSVVQCLASSVSCVICGQGDESREQ